MRGSFLNFILFFCFLSHCKFELVFIIVGHNVADEDEEQLYIIQFTYLPLPFAHTISFTVLFLPKIIVLVSIIM